MGKFHFRIKTCPFGHIAKSRSYTIKGTITSKPVLFPHIGEHMEEFFWENLLVCFYDGIYLPGKNLYGSLIILIPVLAQEMVEVNICDNQRITSKLRFENFLSLFYLRMGIGELVYFPM